MVEFFSLTKSWNLLLLSYPEEGRGKEMNFKKLLVWIVSVFLVLAVAHLAFYYVYHEERMTVPIDKEIENSIPMKEMENKFIVMEWGIFSGAGAGGLGTAQMGAFSAEQFLSLVPEKERIYSAVELVCFPNSCDQSCDQPELYRKKYWAFIEDRAGLMFYQKEYYYSGFVIESYDTENIYFFKQNSDEAWFISIVAFVAACVIIVWVYHSSLPTELWVKRKDRWNK
jgi:hypothetical protein